MMRRLTNRTLDAGSARRWGLVGLILLGLLSSGCGYHFGFVPRADIRTVHVPVFENHTFRREQELVLTRAVIREIQTRTNLRVVGRGKADAVVRGAITDIREAVIVEGTLDEVQASSIIVDVHCVVEDRDGRPISEGSFQETAEFVPARGESIAAAEREALTDVAERVLGLLEDW